MKAGSKGWHALLLPVGLTPTGLPGRKSKGQTPQGGSEGGRGGEEGRREGAWPALRGRALGGGAAAPRSRLWGLGFAALGALGRELEPGTELRSQSSHRDERRSRRLGFSLRPASPARPPDRWESAADTGFAPPAAACAPEGCSSLGCVRRGGRRPTVPLRFSLLADSRRPGDSPAPSLAHLREEPPAAGARGAELGSPGQEGSEWG